MRVPWVVGRRVALARAIAIQTVEANGMKWDRMSQARRDQLVKQADATIGKWIRSGLLATFSHEYRERDDGGDPLVEWKENSNA